MSTENQILLTGERQVEENVAAGTISPGMLIELESADKVQAHSSAGGVGEKAFAVEDALQGNTVDDDYSADDLVSYVIAHPGDQVNAILKAGETAVIGSKLISGGDGTLTVYSASGEVVAVALEALNLSGQGAVATRIKTRIV